MSVDLTPGFNLSHWGPIPYPAATGTKTFIGFGSDKPKASNQSQPKKTDNPKNYTESPISQGGTSGYGSGYGSGSYDPADLAALDAQEGSLRSLLGRSSTYLNQGLTNLNDSYNREVSSANGQRSRALEDFGVQRDDMTNAKTSAIDKVNTNARTLSDSVRRILGMASGSGSSAYQLAAPNAISREASQNRNNVLEDYATNDRNISLAEKRAQEDFDNMLADLASQRSQQERSLREGVLSNEQDINTKLADVAAQRAQLLGGSYASAKAAIAPYQQAINDRQNQLDNLFNQFRNPVLAPKQVTVQKPELRDYVVDRAAINAQNQGGDSQYAPYSNFLVNKKQDDQALLA